MFSGSSFVNESSYAEKEKLGIHLNFKCSKLEILTPSCEDLITANGKIVPPYLPKMFLDLLIPVEGLKTKKMPYDCSICGEEMATWNSLIIHNKSHRHPACLACDLVLASASKLASHVAQFHNNKSVIITSKYGRSRLVKSYLANHNK